MGRSNIAALTLSYLGDSVAGNLSFNSKIRDDIECHIRMDETVCEIGECVRLLFRDTNPAL